MYLGRWVTGIEWSKNVQFGAVLGSISGINIAQYWQRKKI